MNDFVIPNVIKVLHVEDHAADAAYIKAVLESVEDIKFEVWQSGSAAEALLQLKKHRDVDVVLLDLNLPDTQGLETLNYIHHAAPEKPIILVTGENSENAALQYLGFAAQDFISKTEFNPKLLKRLIITAINRFRSHLELICHEQRFRLVVTATSEGIWDWQIIKHEMWLSEQFYALLGYSENEFPATLANWKECFHPEDRKSLLRGIQRHLQEKDIAFHAEHRMITKSGEYIWCLVRGQAMWNEKGDPVRMAGSVVDLTKLKKSISAMDK
ncbi:MAG: PAS domain-containing protein [Gammaproteobacteria bacterium]|nr:PAS domain-containing protein [Gammaproteobacteria bacterium]